MCAKYLEYETKLIHLQLMRSTPAGAGKTKSSSVRLFAHRDHPRGCGENDEAGAIEFNELGSPPQVRGKPNADTAVWAVSGITPAGAGKTPALRSGFRINKDHPRRCGENLRLFCGQYARKGSPPQVRGKRRHSRRFAVITTGSPPQVRGKLH